MGANDIGNGALLPAVLSASGKLSVSEDHRDKVCLTEDHVLWIVGSYATDPAVLAYMELLRRNGVKFTRSVASVEQVQALYARGVSVDREDLTHRQEQVMSIIVEANQRDASDIHFRHEEARTLVFARVDGFFEPVREFNRQDGRAICRAMYGSMCDVAEEQYYENRSQNGRLKSEYLRELGLTGARIGTRPTDDGNLVVLRLLKKGTKRTLADLGYLPEQVEIITRMTRNPFGVNIFSGPTGAGKSTTLEVLVQMLLEYTGHKINILTVEHPPEYRMDGAVQTPLTCDSDDPASVARAWANAIAELLRLDPDVIVIGEVRDLDSAVAAFRAAMTGHGVWTTNHANHAWQTLDRLIDLGVSPALATDASIVTGLINQSLVPINCPACRRQYKLARHTLAPDLQERVERLCNPDTVYVRGRNPGCKICGGRGYKGRRVVAETVAPTQRLMNIYREGGSSAARSAWVQEMNGISKCMHLIRKVNAGEVDPLFAEQQVCTLDYDEITLG